MSPTSSLNYSDYEEALALAERWKDVYTDESYGAAGKNLGILARALLAQAGATGVRTEAPATKSRSALAPNFDCHCDGDWKNCDKEMCHFEGKCRRRT